MCVIDGRGKKRNINILDTCLVSTRSGVKLRTSTRGLFLLVDYVPDPAYLDSLRGRE